MSRMAVKDPLSLVNLTMSLFGASDYASLINRMVLAKALYALVTFMWMLFMPAPYGRYSKPSYGFGVNVKVAWCLQEIPALLVPLYLIVFSNESNFFWQSTANGILIGFFMLHYFHRSLIFPFLIRGGKATPLSPFLAAVAFCLFNGFMQGFYFVNYCKYEDYWLSDMRFMLGLFLFFSGLIINIHSDHVLRNLRKPGETSYKIPNKGLFHYVTGANYFGEILEWSGFAIASWSPTAAVFALFAALFLGQRSFHHHKYYLEKFEDYPKDRKIVIPYIL